MEATFHLQIAALDKLIFDGEVRSVSCRTIHGDLAILARHINYCTAVGMGQAKVTAADGTVRTAACIGGMLTVMDGACRMLVTTWEWSDEIDLNRATEARKRAEKLLETKGLSSQEFSLAEAKLRRALVRIGAANVK